LNKGLELNGGGRKEKGEGSFFEFAFNEVKLVRRECEGVGKGLGPFGNSGVLISLFG